MPIRAIVGLLGSTPASGVMVGALADHFYLISQRITIHRSGHAANAPLYSLSAALLGRGEGTG